MANNALLINAALNGFLSGAVAGGLLFDPTQADYAAIVNQANTFAVAMDAAISNDAAGTPQPAGTPGISVAGGAAIQPAGSSAVLEAQAIKPQLLQSLCFGAAFQRFTTGAPAGQFTSMIAAIKALYFQTLLSGTYT